MKKELRVLSGEDSDFPGSRSIKPNDVVYAQPPPPHTHPREKAHFGETGRGFSSEIGERRAENRHRGTSYAKPVRTKDAGSLADWKLAKVTHEGLNKQSGKISGRERRRRKGMSTPRRAAPGCPRA